MSAVSLSALSAAVASLPDPRSKQGVSHPYHGMLYCTRLENVLCVFCEFFASSALESLEGAWQFAYFR